MKNEVKTMCDCWVRSYYQCFNNQTICCMDTYHRQTPYFNCSSMGSYSCGRTYCDEGYVVACRPNGGIYNGTQCDNGINKEEKLSCSCVPSPENCSTTFDLESKPAPPKTPDIIAVPIGILFFIALIIFYFYRKNKNKKDDRSVKNKLYEL